MLFQYYYLQHKSDIDKIPYGRLPTVGSMISKFDHKYYIGSLPGWYDSQKSVDLFICNNRSMNRIAKANKTESLCTLCAQKC